MSMQRLQIEVGSSHPWFSFIAREAQRQQQQPTHWLVDGSILTSVRIAGVEEFYSLDSIWEITDLTTREQMFQTEWRRVPPVPAF